MRAKLHGFVLIGLLLAAIGFTTSASAGVLIEPYLGYGMGTFTTKSNGSGLEGKQPTSGLVFGGRFGFTVPFFFGALDYSSMNGTSSGNGLDGNAIQNQLAAIVGLKLPFFRVYGGYAFMNDLKIQPKGGDVTYSGTAIKGGVSFTGVPFVAVNLEYVSNTFTNFKAPGLDQAIAGPTYSGAGGDFVIFNISLPFDL